MSDLNSDGSSLGEGTSSSSSSRLPSRAQRHAAEMAREAELEERSRASELARMQTVNFLSKLTKEGHAKEYRKRENDELVERCYFSCTQGFVVMQGELAKRRMLVNTDVIAGCQSMWSCKLTFDWSVDFWLLYDIIRQVSCAHQITIF